MLLVVMRALRSPSRANWEFQWRMMICWQVLQKYAIFQQVVTKTQAGWPAKNILVSFMFMRLSSMGARPWSGPVTQRAPGLGTPWNGNIEGLGVLSVARAWFLSLRHETLKTQVHAGVPPKFPITELREKSWGIPGFPGSVIWSWGFQDSLWQIQEPGMP